MKPAREYGERCKLPQRLRAEPGHQTVSVHSAVKKRSPVSGDSGVEEV